MASSISSQRPTIVLVPGILHTPAHFDRLTGALERLSYPVTPVSLPSIGANASTSPLQADGQAVRHVASGLVEDGKSVVLFGHSYGGVPVSDAVRGLTLDERKKEGKKGGIIQVMFLTAITVRKGETMTDTLERVQPGRGRENPALTPHPTQPNVMQIKDGLTPYLYHDLSSSDSQHYESLLEPLAANHDDQIAVDPPWDMSVKKTYVLCTEDRAIPLETQMAMLEDVKNDTWSVERIASGHSPFLSHVEDLVAVIERAVARGLAE